MRLCALGCIVVACVLSAAARAADSELDTATKDALEGVWLVDERPAGSCARSISSNDQIAFEFRKSQGRLLVYRPFDIFAALPIMSGMRSGDVITLRLDEGGKPRALTFRMFADRLEILASEDAIFKPVSVYRCADPDRSVTEAVSGEQLAALASPRVASGVGVGPVFVQKLENASDESTCDGSSELSGKRPGWLYFELYGPLHYHVMGQGFGGKFDLWPIKSIREDGPKRLAFDLVDRERGGDSWGPGVRGASFKMTVILDGFHIRIPELDATFVRCRRDAPRGKARPSL